MKKIITSVAIFSLSILGFSVNAQDNATNEQQCEQVQSQNTAKKGDFKNKKKFHKNIRPNFFEGIELSETQRAQLKEMRLKIREANKQNSEAQVKASDDADKQQKSRKHKKSAVDRKARIEQMRAEVKTILSPEQYQIFEQNVARFEVKKSEVSQHPRHKQRKHQNMNIQKCDSCSHKCCKGKPVVKE